MTHEEKLMALNRQAILKYKAALEREGEQIGDDGFSELWKQCFPPVEEKLNKAPKSKMTK